MLTLNDWGDNFFWGGLAGWTLQVMFWEGIEAYSTNVNLWFIRILYFSSELLHGSRFQAVSDSEGLSFLTVCFMI